MSELLDMGGEMAVQGTANYARDRISSEAGIPYVNVRVRRVWMKICECEDCQEVGPLKAHDFDEYWQITDKKDPKAVGWWVG